MMVVMLLLMCAQAGAQRLACELGLTIVCPGACSEYKHVSVP